MERLLTKHLGYEVVRQTGSHKSLRSTMGYGMLTFAFHKGQDIAPGLVRKILIKDVGISEEYALKLLGMR